LATERKPNRRLWRGTEATKKPITLLMSGAIFAALLGFAQPVRAEGPDSQLSQLNDAAYSQLRDFVQSLDAKAPAPVAAAGYSVLSDFVQSTEAKQPKMVVAAADQADASPVAKADNYSALRNYAQSIDAKAPNMVVADAKPVTKRATIKKPPPMPFATDGYAKGDPQTCLGCHGQDQHIVAFLKSSPMALKGDQRTPMASGGCESCHGPAAAHVASRMKGGDGEPGIVFKGPNASPVAARNEVCQGCHEGGMLINWQGSQMERAGVACTDCHTVHASEDPVRVKKTQAEVCFGCHAEQRADSFKYSHHPVREGLVVCSDCHNPMGSAGPHELKEFSVNETCYNCHADKRGPMLWEHQPVREDCTNCHTPHGSTQARLMKEPMNFLCSSCHSAVSNGSGGAFGGHAAVFGNLPAGIALSSALANQRQCLNCHSQVHGSNSPNGAYFLR
jgi:DmsE family decaheme c-type cytochrome